MCSQQIVALSDYTDDRQTVIAQCLYQNRPVQRFFDATCIDHNRFVFEKRARLGHAFLQGLKQNIRVGVLQNDANGIEGCAFKVEGESISSHCSR